MSDYRFAGHERVTIELDGTFLPGGLAVPRQLALELDGAGRARVSLFAFDVEGLRVTGVPLLRASYAEVVWRIAVRAGDVPAWWVVACDLGARAPRMLAARYIHYPTRSGTVAVSADRIRVTSGDAALAIALGPTGSAEVAPEIRQLVVGPAAEWEVPWGEDGPNGQPAVATIEDDALAEVTVGAPVTWAPAAFVRKGRQHRCGVARLR